MTDAVVHFPVKLELMSRFHNRNFELLEPYDAKVSRTVLRGESIRKDADLLDKEYYDGLRKVKNLVRDARKVQQTILMVGDITEIYVTSYERMLNDPYFTPEELSAIALGYTKLLEESANLLTDLKTVVNENGLSMNDKERMDIIDRCYTDMLQYRSLVQYYTNKNIGVSYLRAKKQNDLDRVMALYGSPNERYW